MSFFVSAIGITHPFPQTLQLTPGQSSYFSFQIQSGDIPLKCVPLIENTNGLELAFNQFYEIDANQKYNVEPQIIVPEKTAYGTFTASFCMECSPGTGSNVEGSAIIPKICNLPVTVNVVSERTGKNAFDEEEKGNGLIVALLILSLAILVLAIIIFYLVARRKKKLTSI